MAEPKWIYANEEWIKDLQEKAKEVDYYKGYVKGLEYGYKAKEYDRASDCEGCKFVGVSARCEGCCRNYADGYVAEQTEPQKDCKKCKNYEKCNNNHWKCCVYQPKDEPQTEVETMSCQECKHYEVGKPCKPFLNECDCHYEPQTDC